MLASPETAFLGLRGLFVQARRAGDRTRALDIARRAFEMRPKTPWAAQAVFEIETAEEDWGSALKTLDRSLSAKLVSRNEARRRRTVLLTAQAIVAAEAAHMQVGEARKAANETALNQALQAVALDPSFVPAVALAARLCGATGRVRKGAKLVEDAWARSPHPELAEAYMGLVEGESGYDRFKRMKLLAGRNRDHIESRVALARAAIGARDWLAARGALEPYVGDTSLERPTQRVCELMAEIEEGEHGNRGSAREWLARALHAPEDPAWTGEGWRSAVWSPINPVTGEFDALEWRVPGLRLLPSERVTISEPGSEPGSEPASAPVAEDEGDEALSSTGTARPREESHPMRPQLSEDEAVAFPPLLPDDPGPEGADELDAEPDETGGERKW
jgi:HemY protein